MEEGKPSRTAMGAAAYRMFHQMFDRPVIFHDPHAGPILGPPPEKLPPAEEIAKNAAATATLRAQIVARSLFAEETLAAAVARGVDQYVLLGAGLDTFAYRNPWTNLRVFEIDYAATAGWKRDALAKANITIPPNVTYADIDFERETLTDGLRRAGFDLARPAVFAWLGVTVYLTREAITATLRSIASLPPGTEAVFDYGEPREALPEAAQAYMKQRMAALAAAGEPWISFFTPAGMRTLVTEAGFSQIEDLSGADINARWFANRTDGLRTILTTHLVRAKV